MFHFMSLMSCCKSASEILTTTDIASRHAEHRVHIFIRNVSGKTNITISDTFEYHVKENSKDFRYAEGKSKFSEHVLKEGHGMKTIEETMSIIHLENNHRKINTLEIEILKAAPAKHLLNDVIAGQNDPMTNFSPHQ